MEISLPEEFFGLDTEIIEGRQLETGRIVQEDFENPDGSQIIFDRDYLGERRSDHPAAGPIASVKTGYNRIKIWG